MINNEKCVGIIAEYNPFHNGHLYHIQKAKEMTDAKYAVVVMSGNFVQRGEPAIFHKYIRTEMALKCGADLVIEMPVVFSTSSAEDFASCGVALLNKLKIIDALCFGSECGDLTVLGKISSVLAKEPPEFSSLLKIQLKNGVTFPDARKQALKEYLHLEDSVFESLNNPNNILGIEYIKALKRMNSNIVPVTIFRNGDNYHEQQLNSTNPSASALRNHLMSDFDTNMLSNYFPKELQKVYQKTKPIFKNDISPFLNQKILEFANRNHSSEILDLSSSLANRLCKMAGDFDTFDNRIRDLKTRQYTYTRISRSLIHLLLNLYSDDVQKYKEKGYAPYVRILGFKKSSAMLLNSIASRIEVPLITKIANFESSLSSLGISMLKKELYASDIYRMCYFEKYGEKLTNEYSQPLIILP